MLDRNHMLSLRKQCCVLEVPRSSYYFEPKGESKENLEIMHLMDLHYLKHPTSGVLTMQDHLKDLGREVNHKRVRRLLRLMGLEAIYPKKKLSILGDGKYIHPYLLKGLKIERPNQVWAIDITYVPMRKGFMYLTAIIDLYSRFVLAWGISNSLASSACLTVAEDAIEKHGWPEIINSDQGSQFTSKEWIEFWKRNTKISMDGKGRAIDNIFIERLWRTVKYNHIYLHPAQDGKELYEGLKIYFQYYNYERSHQGINRQKPYKRYQHVA